MPPGRVGTPHRHGAAVLSSTRMPGQVPVQGMQWRPPTIAALKTGAASGAEHCKPGDVNWQRRGLTRRTGSICGSAVPSGDRERRAATCQRQVERGWVQYVVAHQVASSFVTGEVLVVDGGYTLW